MIDKPVRSVRRLVHDAASGRPGGGRGAVGGKPSGTVSDARSGTACRAGAGPEPVERR